MTRPPQAARGHRLPQTTSWVSLLDTRCLPSPPPASGSPSLWSAGSSSLGRDSARAALAGHTQVLPQCSWLSGGGSAIPRGTLLSTWSSLNLSASRDSPSGPAPSVPYFSGCLTSQSQGLRQLSLTYCHWILYKYTLWGLKTPAGESFPVAFLARLLYAQACCGSSFPGQRPLSRACTLPWGSQCTTWAKAEPQSRPEAAGDKARPASGQDEGRAARRRPMGLTPEEDRSEQRTAAQSTKPRSRAGGRATRGAEEMEFLKCFLRLTIQ